MLLVDDHVGDDDYYCDDCTVDNEKPKETKDFDDTDDQQQREEKHRHY